MLFLNSWRVSVGPYYVNTHPPAIYKNSIDIQGMRRLNLHSLSVSELLEYRRKTKARPLTTNLYLDNSCSYPPITRNS